MECWSNGVLKYWNVGVESAPILREPSSRTLADVFLGGNKFHYSNAPLLQHSITPTLLLLEDEDEAH
jgi:hypothetical protein